MATGVIVQFGTTPRLYFSVPSDGMDAVDLGTQKVLWHYAAAAIPLLARGHRVLALAPPLGGRMVFLDTDSGNVVAKRPPIDVPEWGPLGFLGSGPTGRVDLEGVSRGGRDFLVWHYWKGHVSGATPPPSPVPVPDSQRTGVVEVNLALATLRPSAEHFADSTPRARVDAVGGSEWGPFETGGMSVTLAKTVRNTSIKLVLRRTRGHRALPDVIVARPPGNDGSLEISADRQHVAGVYLIAGSRDPFKYDVTVYEVATGKRAGHIASDAYPASFLVWNGNLIEHWRDHVIIDALGSGKRLFDSPARSPRSEYVPAGAVERR